MALIQEDEEGASLERANQLQKDFQLKLEEEDVKWRQRAKHHWLKHGDKNTKIFHHATHRLKNKQNISTAGF